MGDHRPGAARLGGRAAIPEGTGGPLTTARSVHRLIAAAALALLPLLAGAQAAEKIPRIGYLAIAAGPDDSSQGFLQGLRELGYVEGQNLVIEYRWAAGRNERLPELAAKLVSANVDLIVTAGTPATLAAKQATPAIPIVFNAAAPVEKGIVASLARPGGNLTGIALVSFVTKSLELLKEAAPGVSSVAFLYDPATLVGAVGGVAGLRPFQDGARTIGITLEPAALHEPDETDGVFAALPADTNGLLLENSGVNILARDRICALAAQRRLPAAGNALSFARAGCLISYGEDIIDISRRKAGYVDRILKGAQPADLPVEQPTKFDLIINLKTAKELGLTIPRSLFARAEEVIE
jgi:putative tryptophan/tyrosine transport system substrate-binding protein